MNEMHTSIHHLFILLFMLILALFFPKRTYLRFNEICAPDIIHLQALIF